MARFTTVAAARQALDDAETAAELRAVLRALPPALDALVPARVVFTMFDDAHGSSYLLLRSAPTLEARIVRAVVALCASRAKKASRVFLAEAIDVDASDREVERRWEQAVRALVAFDASDGWGSTALFDRLRRIAKDERLCAATAAAVVATRALPARTMLAVLVMDGSVRSLDALVPHVRRPAFRRLVPKLLKVASPETRRLLESGGRAR